MGVSLFVTALFLISIPALAQNPPAAPPAGARAGGRGGPAAPANVVAAGPLSVPRHESFLEVAKKGNIDLLFVGDSITDWFFWPRGGE